MDTGELILIRHGPTDSPVTLNGRTDVGLAERPGAVSLQIGALWVSPARRARETAMGLFPGVEAHQDERLWEQDFGAWDGLAYSDLPDVGDLSREELADLRAEGGESFREIVERTRPAIEAAAKVAKAKSAPVAVVAHAGTVRAALACATGDIAGALAFEVDYLKATRFRCLANGLAVRTVNEALR